MQPSEFNNKTERLKRIVKFRENFLARYTYAKENTECGIEFIFGDRQVGKSSCVIDLFDGNKDLLVMMNSRHLSDMINQHPCFSVGSRRVITFTRFTMEYCRGRELKGDIFIDEFPRHELDYGRFIDDLSLIVHKNKCHAFVIQSY